MLLHLNQAILYQEAPFSAIDAEEAYQQLNTYLAGQKVGSEGCLALSSTLKLLFCGVQGPADEATRYAVENALPLKRGSDPYAIEPGTYTFLQCAPTQSLQELADQIPHLYDGPNCIYVRLFKETELAIIAQLWVAS